MKMSPESQRKFPAFSVRFRYLFSFLTIALIPLVSILVFFYHYNVQELTDDVESINSSRVAQIRSGFESEIRKHFGLARAICDDPALLTLLRRPEQQSAYQALILFRQYVSYRGMDSLTALMMTEEDRVYTTTGFSSGQAFFRESLRLDAAQTEMLRALLKSDWRTISFTAVPILGDSGEQRLLCLYPLPSYTGSPAAVMAVVLEKSRCASLFEPILGRLQGSAFILNERQEMILQMNSAGEDPAQVEQAVGTLQIPGAEGEALPVLIGGQKYSVLCSYSEQTGLTYGIAAKDDIYLTQVIRQTTLLWEVVLLALAICVIAILLLTFLNYRPMKRLVALTGNPQKPRGDEYETIRAALISNTTKSERLELLLEQQRPFLLEHLLEYALYSETTPEQIRQLFYSMNLTFPHPCFFVTCVKALRNNSVHPGYSYFKEAVIDTVETIGTDGGGFYSVERFGENEIIIVANCPGADLQREQVSLLQEKIGDRIGGEYLFAIGVGSVRPRIEELKDSLYEASVLVENRSGKPVSYPEDIGQAPSAGVCIYPVKDIMLFQQQLRQGDCASARSSFDQLSELAESSNTRSMILSRYLYSYIINAITEAIQQSGGTGFDEQIQQLMLFNTPEELHARAHALIADFCRYINEGKRSSNSKLRDDILAYIRENLSNEGLSLESIGEAFNLSPYYVSRFFREQNNINLKDYVARLRLELAKEMLVTTNKAVAEIVSEVGYISTSSFIRKFRLSEGMTPGEYRTRFSKPK